MRNCCQTGLSVSDTPKSRLPCSSPPLVMAPPETPTTYEAGNYWRNLLPRTNGRSRGRGRRKIRRDRRRDEDEAEDLARRKEIRERELAALKRFLVLPVACGVAQAGDRSYVEKSLKSRLVFTARTSNCRCAVLCCAASSSSWLVCMRREI
jgi:hypothetical protein